MSLIQVTLHFGILVMYIFVHNQVEERAIEGLLQKYSAINNPDEYITVERCSRSCHRKKRLSMSPKEGKTAASPWSRGSYRPK